MRTHLSCSSVPLLDGFSCFLPLTDTHHRTLHQKIDTLLGGGAVDKRGVEGSVLPDLTAIKNTEANILHQISDLK